MFREWLLIEQAERGLDIQSIFSFFANRFYRGFFSVEYFRLYIVLTIVLRVAFAFYCTRDDKGTCIKQ